jgi:K+-transporting ATPase ATPase C chain
MGKQLWRQSAPALLAIVVFTVLCGVVYPLAVTGIGQAAFNHKANGSLIEQGGVVIGSELLGQNFSAAGYFWPRPSAAGATGYDGSSSGGSNLGPTNEDLLAAVAQRVEDYRTANNLAVDAPVPVDAVTTSASGLDPHISVANARLQTARVAQARGVTEDKVKAMVESHINDPIAGFLGERTVNVLQLNLALDKALGAIATAQSAGK